MRASIASIRKELTGIYPREEIDSLIFLIFEKVKGYSRTQFLLAGEDLLTGDEVVEIHKIVSRLKNQEPIQYILGQTEFYGLPFYSAPGVLIPRPETEELVQWIIQETTLPSPTLLDIGTGTGCIAISLQKNIRQAKVLACDISPVCIETSLLNAEFNDAPISVFEYDILNYSPPINFPGLDIIVSNPPYVRETEKRLMNRNVLNYEPALALFVSDEHPLVFYEWIADFALLHLNNKGHLYFEINEAFGPQCVEMLYKKGFSDIQLKKDINGKDRMIRSVISRP